MSLSPTRFREYPSAIARALREPLPQLPVRGHPYDQFGKLFFTTPFQAVFSILQPATVFGEIPHYQGQPAGGGLQKNYRSGLSMRGEEEEISPRESCLHVVHKTWH